MRRRMWSIGRTRWGWLVFATNISPILLGNVWVDFDRAGAGPMAVLTVLFRPGNPILLATVRVEIVAGDSLTAAGLKPLVAIVESASGLGKSHPADAGRATVAVARFEFHIHDPCFLGGHVALAKARG